MGNSKTKIRFAADNYVFVVTEEKNELIVLIIVSGDLAPYDLDAINNECHRLGLSIESIKIRFREIDRDFLKDIQNDIRKS